MYWVSERRLCIIWEIPGFWSSWLARVGSCMEPNMPSRFGNWSPPKPLGTDNLSSPTVFAWTPPAIELRQQFIDNSSHFFCNFASNLKLVGHKDITSKNKNVYPGTISKVAETVAWKEDHRFFVVGYVIVYIALLTLLLVIITHRVNINNYYHA